MFQIESEILSIKSDILFSIASFPITNTMIAGILTTLFLTVFAIFVNSKVKTGGKPTGFQVLVENYCRESFRFYKKNCGR